MTNKSRLRPNLLKRFACGYLLGGEGLACIHPESQLWAQACAVKIFALSELFFSYGLV